MVHEEAESYLFRALLVIICFLQQRLCASTLVKNATDEDVIGDSHRNHPTYSEFGTPVIRRVIQGNHAGEVGEWQLGCENHVVLPVENHNFPRHVQCQKNDFGQIESKSDVGLKKTIRMHACPYIKQCTRGEPEGEQYLYDWLALRPKRPSSPLPRARHQLIVYQDDLDGRSEVSGDGSGEEYHPPE